MSGSTADTATRRDTLIARYRELYRCEPTVVSRAPGRIEIIGNHTDHNGGTVVAASVHLDTLVVAGPSDDTALHLKSRGWSCKFTAPAGASPDSLQSSHDTERLMAGVCGGLETLQYAAPPYRAVMDSTVLPGSGVSSSAALEVALAGVHSALAGEQLSPVDAARAGQYAENHYMGKPSGLMDQLASSLGGVNVMDFSSQDAPQHRQIRPGFHEAGLAVLLINTGGSHGDLTDDYAAIPGDMHRVASLLGVPRLVDTSRTALLNALPAVRQSAGDQAVLRALHFFDEQDRVAQFAAIAEGSPRGEAREAPEAPRILTLLRESGHSSWRLLQNIYPGGAREEQPVALTLAVVEHCLQTAGGTGVARVHGGGFAGTILVLLPTETVPQCTRQVESFLGAGAVLPVTLDEAGLQYALL